MFHDSATRPVAPALSRLLGALALLLACSCSTTSGSARHVSAAETGETFDPRWTILGSVGSGDLGVEIDDSDFEEEVDADFFRLKLQHRWWGIDLESTHGDEDLTPDADIDGTDFFVYGRARLFADERVQLPLRYGLMVNTMSVDEPGGDIDWISVGPRLGFDPEVAVLSSEALTWTLFSELQLGFALTVIDVDADDFSDEFSSDALFTGIELGTRLRFAGGLLLGLSWLHRNLDVDESDSEDGVFIRGTEFEFDGLAFSIGWRG